MTARIGGVAIREGVMPIHVFEDSSIKKLTSQAPKTQEPRNPPVVLIRAIGDRCGLPLSIPSARCSHQVACAA